MGEYVYLVASENRWFTGDDVKSSIATRRTKVYTGG
jgi:hypothetical protein